MADVVWRAFGDPNNFVEPFAGSLAVLLLRPGEPRIETVNDKDCAIANFWRAIQADAPAVAKHADWPVNEADLHARHQRLVDGIPALRRKVMADPDYFDAKSAGWWVWGMCQWIGAGWCAPRAHVKRKVPSLKNAGQGVHLPYLRVNPTKTQAGVGVHAQSVLSRMGSLGNDRGINGIMAAPLVEWFTALQVRLRKVRVACGDWKRVLGPSVLGKGKNVGGRRPCAVFLDPPYAEQGRSRVYNEEQRGLAEAVSRWAFERGDDPDLRIALCSYEGQIEPPRGWRVHAWKAHGGYGGEDNDNAARERVYFSPHCLDFDQQKSLFEGS